MQATHPLTEEKLFFVEKCLAFGVSISCAHFQRFSNALHHTVITITGRPHSITNYLDDFIFIEVNRSKCNWLLRKFLFVCSQINLMVSMEKTYWATTNLTFLGILLDGKRSLLVVPEEKRIVCLNMLHSMISKRSVTIGQLQSLAGKSFLLRRAVVPGRAFTRRMYTKFTNLFDTKGSPLKKFHHVKTDAEFRSDCMMWTKFLNHTLTVARPWTDLSLSLDAQDLFFYTDASIKETNGIGCLFNQNWTCAKWEPDFIRAKRLSIAFAKLLALCVGVFTRAEFIQNTRIVIYCDNISVRDMVNHTTSGCKNCMFLIRKLTLNNLKYNRRVFIKYVKSQANFLADALSRQNIGWFK